MAKDGKTVILVADDEPSMLAIVASHLRAKGYMVLEASDGDQAWELAHEHLPDLVVLDVMMPGMSGWEVCRKIREAVSLAHTGVVMLTGIGENLNEMTSPLYGADGYVDKPFEFPQLDKRIQEALERRRAGAVGRLDGSEVDVAADETNSVDQGWSDPGTMPGVEPDEEKPARAKKPKAERAAKTKQPPAGKPEAKPAKATAKKPAKSKAKAKPAAKAKTAKKPARAAKKAAKAAKRPAKAAASAKAKSKTKVPAKPAAKAKAAKPAAKGKAGKQVARAKTAKPAAKGKAGKPAAKASGAKPAAKKSKAEVSKLSLPAMKSAARTGKKAGKKKK
jgi:CheY-like chemotaxis protein